MDKQSERPGFDRRMTKDEIKYFKRRLSGFILEFNRDSAKDSNPDPRRTEKVLNLLVEAETELYVMEAESKQEKGND